MWFVSMWSIERIDVGWARVSELRSMALLKTGRYTRTCKFKQRNVRMIRNLVDNVSSGISSERLEEEMRREQSGSALFHSSISCSSWKIFDAISFFERSGSQPRLPPYKVEMTLAVMVYKVLWFMSVTSGDGIHNLHRCVKEYHTFCLHTAVMIRGGNMIF